MPGLFGFKIKTAGNAIDQKKLADRMAESLVHGSFYRSAYQSIKDGAMGIVHTREIEKKTLWQNAEAGTTTAIYGKLYDLIDLPANAPVIQKPLDGSAIAALYAFYGSSTAKHLNGDFNFCLDDEKTGRLIICNDRFGFRHLYIYEDEQILMFAPELKAFLQYPDFDKTLDEHGLADYFNYSYQLGHRTFFRRATLLPPASILSCSQGGGIERNEYWTAKYDPRLDRNHLDEAIEEGHSRFMQSMERRVAGKQNMIIPLSGGLDSRLITATAVDLGCQVTTATFGFRKSTDVRIARQVTKALGLPDPVLVEVRPEFISRYALQVGELGECSYSSLGMTTIHAFADILGPEYDGLLNGIFGGHISFGSPYFKSQAVMGNMTLDQFLDRLSRGLEGQRFNLFLGESAMPKLKELTNAYLRKSVAIEWERTLSASSADAFRLDQLFVYNRIRRCMNAIDHNRFFYVDELPFASYELFDFYHSLDPDLLLDHYLYKAIYKNKFPRLAAIPWQSTGVNLYNKPSAWTQKIKSWEAKLHWYVRRISKGRLNPASKDKYEDQDAAYRKHRPLKQWMNELILSERHLARGYFSRQGLLRLIQREESGSSAFFELSKIAMFELWARRFLDAR